MLRKMRQTTGKSEHGNSIKGWNHRGEILLTLKWMVKPLLALLGSVLHARLPVCWGMCGCVGFVRCRVLGSSACSPNASQLRFRSCVAT